MDRKSGLYVLLVDPDKFVRTFLADALVNAGFKIFNSVDNSTDALNGLGLESIQVAILEIKLAGLEDGYDLANSLRKINPNVGIVFLTKSQDSRFGHRIGAIKPEGSRYLVKKEIQSIPYLISVISQTIHRPFYENINQENMFTELTDLQVEVWKEVAQGDSSSKIAAKHKVSEKAIEGIISRIYKVLGMTKNNDSNMRVMLCELFNQYKGGN